jgi:hypothetical protein
MTTPATVIELSIQRMVCTACAAEANATCNCGVAYQPKTTRAAEAIKANPEKSDRAIAKEIGASPTTVGKAREQLSTSGQLNDEPRIGLDGKARKLPRRQEADAADRTEARRASRWQEFQAAESEGDALGNILEAIRSLTDEQRSLLFQTLKKSHRNSVLTAALNAKEIEAGRTWPPDMNKKQQGTRDRYLESISYFQLELERLYAEVTKQPSWRAEIITKSGERLVNGARFATRGEVDAYAFHLSKEGQGKIEVEVIPCEDDKPNVLFQGSEVRFAHGDCVLLNWRPAQANEHAQ